MQQNVSEFHGSPAAHFTDVPPVALGMFSKIIDDHKLINQWFNNNTECYIITRTRKEARHWTRVFSYKVQNILKSYDYYHDDYKTNRI